MNRRTVRDLIGDPLMRTCVALALTPGMAVHDAISNPIE